MLGDASSNKFVPDEEVIDSLAAESVNLFGLNFGSTPFADSITDLGGTVFDGGTTPEEIIAAVTAGIEDTLSVYSEVTIDDLMGGDPLIDVSTACVSADTGTCSGAVASGDYDRSVDRSFDFDVTFTRLEEGNANFDTFALVDGGIVATEADSFGAIPLPAAGWLLIAGLGGLAAMRRRKA